MRIVFLLDGWTVNAWYRLVAPLQALEAMGHQVRELTLEEHRLWDELLLWGELLLIHRSSRLETVRLARRAQQLGVPIVWDDDDDLTKVPKGSAAYRNAGGLRGQQLLRERAKLFELVDLVTTPSDQLGRSYLRGGAPDVCVMENYVIDEFLRVQPPRDGTWIGWVASEEHRFDLQHIPITAALARLLDAHQDVHVKTIGVRLPLRHPRYVHVPGIPPRELLGEISTFDVGIAPLSTKVAINHSRSNVKVKEYAAVGVPWLASPIGPYVGLGEDEGGRLVADDRWYEELDALVSNPRERQNLAERAARWGQGQLLSENIEDWEEEFLDLVENAGQRRAS
ncbi:MAG: hypothetical protein ACJ76L_01675 [Conexibacter sp.]